LDEKTQNKEKEKTIEQGAEDQKTEETDPIIRAEKAAEALRIENERLERNIREQKEMAARDIISGRGRGKEQEKQETEDEKWAREARLRYAGTGLDPT